LPFQIVLDAEPLAWVDQSSQSDMPQKGCRLVVEDRSQPLLSGRNL
jgi:hypothetical protein